MTQNAKAERTETYVRVAKPSHVPDEMVVDFDYMAAIPPGEDNYTVLRKLQDIGHDILWTPCNGGHWIVTRAEDIRWVQENYQTFSHEVFIIPRAAVNMIWPPLTADPPNHARYRAVLNPSFTPAKVARMEQKARAVAIELIEQIKAKGRCDFVEDFARILPVVMFLEIVDLPVEHREQYLAWEQAYQRATNLKDKDRAAEQIKAYLQRVLDERHRQPGDDLLSAIARWRDNKRFGGEDEVIGMAFVLFLGGLDTVASMLTYTARHLARHPEHRRRLIEEPDVIPRAVEEFLRRHGLSNTGRLIMRDVERKSVRMKADEMIMVPIGCSGIDERLYSDPFTVDFDRAENFVNGIPAHNTFGNGPHKCVGSPLARMEIRVFLEEWLKRIPDFSLDPDRPSTVHMGPVPGLDDLNLIIG